MKKDLFMHFRVFYKLTPVEKQVPGTSNKVTEKILKPYLGKRGKDASQNGGVTVCGALLDHPLLGLVIMWGASLCLDETFKNKEGREYSYEHSLGNDFMTKNVSYKNAKQIACVIAQRIYDHQNIKEAMKYLFTPYTDRLPVEDAPKNAVPLNPIETKKIKKN